MRSLAEIQHCFSADIFDRDGEREYQYIRADGLGSANRLDIYRNNVFHNYREALRAVYPVVEQLVGSAFFDHIADEYIRAYPSDSGDLNSYGALFPKFLETLISIASLPYLVDVAQLEWLMDEAFHAADHLPLNMAELGQLSVAQYGNLKFVLHPACRLLNSKFPVDKIWQTNQPNWDGDTHVDIAQGGVMLLVSRTDFAVTMRPLAQGEFAMLTMLAEGHCFSECYESAIKIALDFDVASFLQTHISTLTFVNFSIETQ